MGCSIESELSYHHTARVALALSASVDSPRTTALRIRGATPKGISRVCTLFGHAIDHRTAAARARRFHSHSRLRGLRARADDLSFFDACTASTIFFSAFPSINSMLRP